MISSRPSFADSKRKRWLRSVTALATIPSISHDSEAVHHRMHLIINCGNAYLAALGQNTGRPPEEHSSEASVVRATIGAAETILGMHADKPYGMHPSLAYWLTDNDQSRIYCLENQHRQMPTPSDPSHSRLRFLDPLLRVFELDSRSRYLRACAKRGKILAEKFELILPASMRALDRLTGSIVETGLDT